MTTMTLTKTVMTTTIRKTPSETTYQPPMSIEEGGNIGQEGCLQGTQVGNLAKTWHLKKGGHLAEFFLDTRVFRVWTCPALSSTVCPNCPGVQKLTRWLNQDN